MDLNAFWALVESSAVEASDQDDRLVWLTAAPAELPAAEVVEFAVRLDEVRRRMDTWVHWQAADVICGGLCCDDGFSYFQAWLVGQGRAVFDAVASSPDALAGLPHVRLPASRGGVQAWADDEWPDWEGLDPVAAEAFDGDLGRVSTSVFAIVGPGGAADGPTDNSGMRALRPHRQEPPQARLSSNEASIHALEPVPASLGLPVSPEPAGEQWDFAAPAEFSARVPRLGALFGKVA